MIHLARGRGQGRTVTKATGSNQGGRGLSRAGWHPGAHTSPSVSPVLCEPHAGPGFCAPMLGSGELAATREIYPVPEEAVVLGAGFTTRRAAAAVVSCEGAEGAAGARAIWARAAVAAAVPAPGWTPVGHCNCPPPRGLQVPPQRARTRAPSAWRFAPPRRRRGDLRLRQRERR